VPAHELGNLLVRSSIDPDETATSVA